MRTHVSWAADNLVRAAAPARSAACAAVVVAGLRKNYGAVQAVRGVSFTVEHGEIFALLGPNGAGKTTTLEILEGFRARDAGRVEVLGFDPGDRASGRAVRERIGLVLQDIAVEPYLTVRETIARNAGYYPAPHDTDEVIALVGLAGQERKKVRNLSGGQKRRLDLALGLIGDPELLFLDEPTTGFDPNARRERVGRRPRPARRGRHDRAHHALHGRGAGAGRPGGGDLRRPDHGRGNTVGHRRTRHRPVTIRFALPDGYTAADLPLDAVTGERPGRGGDRRADPGAAPADRHGRCNAAPCSASSPLTGRAWKTSTCASPAMTRPNGPKGSTR